MSGRVFWIAIGILGAGLVLLIATNASGEVLGLESRGFGRLVLLTALITVFGAAILRSRMGIGNVARNLGAWLFIVLALVAVYQYRFDLQDIANRISGGLFPGSPVSLSDGAGGERVLIEKSSDGHFAARGRVNGIAVNLLVDTGASSTVLTTQDAARIGVDTSMLRYDIPISTANGTATAARMTASSIEIGSIVRRNVPLLVAQPGMLEQSLLGMNFIGTLSSFELRGSQMILRD